MTCHDDKVYNFISYIREIQYLKLNPTSIFKLSNKNPNNIKILIYFTDEYR